ncbi:28 kDa ribonucleoprotein, chloroplastic-like [Diospyros lotus]|uniref:28 kDa ribonucleoprotein, chloroplastic-like n=1 Tax=Diospyros lotus TaxID=55363 RepID=UPI00224CDC63|nr:28 kDa ribonucleoprotein, chloroplastic-like [Diospyros lotus]
MAAAAAAAIGSSFSTSMQTLKCVRSNNNWPSDPLLRVASTSRVLLLQVGLASQFHPAEVLSFSQKWRIPRISAAVAQEEAAAAAEAEMEAPPPPPEEEGAADPANTKLYFGNLPYHCDSAQLAGIIQQYASPELVEVLYDRDSGRSRGFAFVTMSSIEDCNAIIQNLDGREYGGRTLRVNFSDKPRAREPLYPETEYKLFVGNLAWSVTSESLTQAFQEYGNVVGARVLYDGETGRSRGYGFVCYLTKSEMDAALESLNGVELEGRAMRVSLAQGKRQ